MPIRNHPQPLRPLFDATTAEMTPKRTQARKGSSMLMDAPGDAPRQETGDGSGTFRAGTRRVGFGAACWFETGEPSAILASGSTITHA